MALDRAPPRSILELLSLRTALALLSGPCHCHLLLLPQAGSLELSLQGTAQSPRDAPAGAAAPPITGGQGPAGGHEREDDQWQASEATVTAWQPLAPGSPVSQVIVSRARNKPRAARS